MSFICVAMRTLSLGQLASSGCLCIVSQCALCLYGSWHLQKVSILRHKAHSVNGTAGIYRMSLACLVFFCCCDARSVFMTAGILVISLCYVFWTTGIYRMSLLCFAIPARMFQHFVIRHIRFISPLASTGCLCIVSQCLCGI